MKKTVKPSLGKHVIDPPRHRGLGEGVFIRLDEQEVRAWKTSQPL